MAGENYGFQSTHSLRSATGLSNLLRWRASRFNPRTPCGVRPVGQGWQIADVSVSIHALLAECDARWPGPPIRTAGFNPRTPCGVRQETTRPEVVKLGFQSTHSLRSATGTSRQYSYVRSGFNPRTPCGVRPHGPHVVGQPGGFNPRTPCGVRRSIWGHHVNSMEFQSTHSLRSATWPWRGSGDKCAVSIHALLAECDVNALSFSKPSQGFNPRTPCGVRLRPTLYIATQQSKSYFAPTSLKRPSLHGCSF